MTPEVISLTVVYDLLTVPLATADFFAAKAVALVLRSSIVRSFFAFSSSDDEDDELSLEELLLDELSLEDALLLDEAALLLEAESLEDEDADDTSPPRASGENKRQCERNYETRLFHIVCIIFLSFSALFFYGRRTCQQFFFVFSS